MFLYFSTLVPGNESSPTQYEDVDYETEHAKRKKDIEINDAVHRVSLRDVLQSQVNICLYSSILSSLILFRAIPKILRIKMN